MSNLSIEQNTQGNTTTFVLEGRLDSITSSDLMDRLVDAFDKAESVVLDLEKLVYMSSAGLRVILAGQKKANATGKDFKLVSVNPELHNVLGRVGFLDIFAKSNIIIKRKEGSNV